MDREMITKLEDAYLASKRENAQLRARVRELEEERRWRKWPEEKPDKDGKYLLWDGDSYKENSWFDGGWRFEYDWITHWRPIGTMPEVRG
jgi:hypothetical protein